MVLLQEKGVYQDDNKKKIINKLDMATFKSLKSKGIISKGMIPKVSNSFNGLKNEFQKFLLVLRMHNRKRNLY